MGCKSKKGEILWLSRNFLSISNWPGAKISSNENNYFQCLNWPCHGPPLYHWKSGFVSFWRGLFWSFEGRQIRSKGRNRNVMGLSRAFMMALIKPPALLGLAFELSSGKRHIPKTSNVTCYYSCIHLAWNKSLSLSWIKVYVYCTMKCMQERLYLRLGLCMIPIWLFLLLWLCTTRRQ